MKKAKFMVGVLSVLAGIIFLAYPGDTAYASELFLREEYVDEISPEQIYIPLSERPCEERPALKGSAVYHSDWDRYSSNLVYNQLSEQERLLWDGLDEMCLGYLTGDKDLEDRTEYVQTTLSRNNAYRLAFLFIYSNPQYYFINGYAYASGSSRGLALTSYQEFQSGVKRAGYTRQMQNELESIVRRASLASNDADRLRVLHDAIVGGVEYNDYIFADGEIDDTEEETYFTQSAYSALCLDYTVCAGYAKAFEMVCNALGIDCIAITSKSHAWNKVRINGSWYNVDCTWDDRDGKIFYNYYGRSDRVFNESDHKPESEWNNLLPFAALDTGSTSDVPGIFPAAVGSTASPQISMAESSRNGIYVIITCSSADADIYYTVDGGLPSQSATRSYRYTGPFTVSRVKTLRAIAVQNACYDSEVVDYAIPDATSLTGASVELEYDTAYYDGSAHTPAVTVTLDDQLLIPNEDYLVRYENNIALGRATVYVIGSGRYIGTLTADFSIVLAVPELKAPASTASAVTVKWKLVTGASGYYVYRKTKGGKYEEIADVDDGATISYKDTDVTNGTTYIYTVKAYNGDHTSDWTRAGVKQVWLSRPTVSAASVSAQKLTLKWSGNNKVTGYEISYTVGSTTKTVRVTGAATLNKVIASLKKGKTYKIMVRGYKTAGGTTYYSAWSKVKNVKI